MDDGLHSLEREIEREMTRWADRLDVPPHAQQIALIRAAVRREADEAWLAAQPSPPLRPGALQRVRSAVAAELRAPGSREGSQLRWWISSQGLGSLGAAAMLLLCAGLVWYAGTLRLSAPAMFADSAAGNSADPTDAELVQILAEVQSLEKDLSEDAPINEDESESLGDLVREIDRLIEEHATERSTSAADRPGVLG